MGALSYFTVLWFAPVRDLYFLVDEAEVVPTILIKY